MKIQIISDIHCDSWASGHLWDYINPTNADALSICGDVGTERYIHNLITEALTHYEYVFFVFGNHDFYFNNIDLQYKVKLAYRYNDRVFIFTNDLYEINGIKIFGGVMWSNPNPIFDMEIRNGIADFMYIKDWSVEKMRLEHSNFCKKLTEVGQPDIILSHFVPCYKSVHNRYKYNPLCMGINEYFTTDMTAYMYGVKLWIHGHTHDDYNYVTGDTRIICNPVGYCGELQYWDKELVVSV